MNHPFIVKLNYAFQTEDKLYLLMDYCPNGDLEMVLNRVYKFPEKVAKLYIAEMVLALEALHKACIIYRDLKPSNIVIDQNGHALLTDFGLSKEGLDNQTLTKSFCGSVAYLAPEMLEKQGHGYSLDWYLLGVLTYELINGLPPFYCKNQEQLFNNIMKGELQFSKAFSVRAQSFIREV